MQRAITIRGFWWKGAEFRLRGKFFGSGSKITKKEIRGRSHAHNQKKHHART